MTRHTMPFQLGKRHALQGIRAMAHRKGRRYDSANANESYHRGYGEGMKEKLQSGKKLGLDYTNPLNNQLFEA